METTLTALLQPGEMLRFSMTRTRHGSRYAVEGESAGSTKLKERLGTVLRLARDSGYRFAERQVAEPVDSLTSEGLPAWREIRPKHCRVALRSNGRLGFGSGEIATVSHVGDTALRVPRFAPPLSQGLIDRVFEDLMRAPGILAVEVDFEAFALSGEQAEQLGALRDRLVESQRGGSPEGGGLLAGFESALRYLDLWLWHRSGYRVKFRARSAEGPADAVLDLAGRGLYEAECTIGAPVPEEGAESGEHAFALAYPSGWPFPPLMPRRGSRTAEGPATLHNLRTPRMPRRGTPIGTVEGAKVRLPVESRASHTYVAGATGTGKSTLLLRLLADDMRRGESVVLLDPHGDLVRAALDLVPPGRRGDVFLVDPANGELPDFNVLDIPRDAFHRRTVDLLADSLLHCFFDLWEGVDAFGPVFETYYLNTLLLLALQREIPVSLADFPEVLTSDSLRERLLAHCENEAVKRFWTETACKARGEIALANVAPYISSKIYPLLQGEGLAKLLCGGRDEWRLDRRIDEGGIVLVNLDKGTLGARQSRVLGSLIIGRLFGAGLARSARPASQRKPVNIHIDEFQNFVSGSVASMLSEARKFGLRLTLANQTLGQLEGSRRSGDLLGTVLGNAANQLFFRLGVADSRRLADFTAPWTPGEMQFLTNHHALARISEGGIPLPPFVFRTLPPPAKRKPKP